jgi:uncharacterized protein (TIGR02266 family)
VSDPNTTSKSAREALARGLNALQADPSVPPHLVELAAPIAQSMGALHQIEKTGQLAPHADVALNHLRGALAALQAVPPSHPAVAAALDSVASALGLVHTLSRMANGPAAAPPQPQPAQAPAPAPQPPPNPPALQPQAPPNQPRTRTAGMEQRAPQQPQAQPRPPQQAPPQQQPQRDPFAARDPFGAPAPQGAPAVGGPGGKPPTPSMPVPAPPNTGNLAPIAADLGAHSPTNFYKGLSGNDIIDHGGLFVSTYVPPKPGTAVRLKVSLPGGYEFEANAVVKWVREQGGDAPPGFGAQFTAITPEARQLVYRYVRNREPLFHDDF